VADALVVRTLLRSGRVGEAAGYFVTVAISLGLVFFVVRVSVTSCCCSAV
jgi:hypothetical protein